MSECQKYNLPSIFSFMYKPPITTYDKTGGFMISKFLLLTTMLMPTLAFSAQINSDLGRGLSEYDTKLNIKDRCINSLFDHNSHKEDIRSTNYSLILIKNKEELIEKMTSDSTSQGSYSAFSAGVKHSFAKEIIWKYNNTYILIKATRLSYKETISNDRILLSSEARNLLLDSRFKFLESCGTSFIKDISYGGEIYGLIEISSSTYEEKRKIEASLEASGKLKLASGSSKAKFSHAIRELTDHYQAKINFKHIGGKQINVPTDVSTLLEISTKIEEMSDQSPVVLEYETRNYNTLSNFIYNDAIYETKIKQDQLDYAESKLKQARMLYANILTIIEYPESFYTFDSNYLNEKLNYLELKILELKKFIYQSYSFLEEKDLNEIEVDFNVNLPKKRMLRISAFGGKREVSLPIKCEEKESPLCGVKKYKTMASPACEAVGTNSGTGPSCGQTYNVQSSEFCGIKLYNQNRGAACGIELYRKCHTKSCGKNWDGSRKKCRSSKCGVELFKSCRDQSFGVEEYNTCEHPKHGIKEFLTCNHRDFGFKFKTCEHISHGPEQYNTCNIAKVGKQETFCPNI